MRLVNTGQADWERPPCPNAGYAGGPIHPAHAVEVQMQDRVADALPEGAPGSEEAAFAQRRSGMRLFTDNLADQHNQHVYYEVAYLHCLTCGLILPAQQVRQTL